MNIEEKAKAYDEALEKAKECHEKYWQVDAKFITETLFPELRENEDERIRKALIDALKVSETIGELKFRLPYPTREECIAYLEKQKYDRMKPVYDNQDSFESALEKAWKDYNDSGARTVDGCEDDYVECAHAKGFREGYLFGIEKQKEPKHATDDLQKSFEAGQASIVDNPEQYGLCKKPAWTEEDEKMRNLAIEWAETMSGQFSFVDMDSTDFRKIIAWLKDLRPSWKPSKKQMNCLCAAVDAAIRKHNESVSGYKPARVLKSLYEDLKKLM